MAGYTQFCLYLGFEPARTDKMYFGIAGLPYKFSFAAKVEELLPATAIQLSKRKKIFLDCE